MQACLYVGLGGFIGSVLRYLLGCVPLRGDYPLVTMLINLTGSFVLGALSEFTQGERALDENVSLFLRTGLCGGFTTFSTFTLETLTLFRSGKLFFAASYAVASVLVCLLGAYLGVLLAKAIRMRLAA